MSAAQLQTLQDGCPLEGGRKLKPVYLDLASLDAAEDRLRIVVKDGRNREVVTLLEHVGVGLSHRPLLSLPNLACIVCANAA